MNTEFKKLAITNRISRLKARGKENYSIIKKLERILAKLGA